MDRAKTSENRLTAARSRSATRRTRSRRRGGVARRLALGCAVLVCAGAGMSAAPVPAASASEFRWSGADVAAPGPNWSDPANWDGDAAPAADSTIGALDFRALDGSGCATSRPVAACFASNNDLSGLTVGRLAIQDAAYDITGAGITLDHGLVTGGPHPYGSPEVVLPITLGGAQIWDLRAGLQLGAPLRGNVRLAVANPDELGLRGDNELGSLWIDGGTVDLYGADVNSADGNAVRLAGAQLDVYGTSAALGALTAVDTELVLGLPAAADGPVALTVRSATLAAGSTLVARIGSELSSTGRIALGRVALTLNPAEHSPVCDGDPLGTVDTLVSTTGSLSGRFANAPEGAVLSDGCDEYEIRYHAGRPANRVTATLLGAPTTTMLAASPQPAPAARPVTLQATILSPDEPGVLVGGTVAFRRDGALIAGCRAVPVSYVETAGDYVADCRTSFAAAGSTLALRAAFTPPAGSGDLPSAGGTALAVAAAGAG